jgi:hypothetical protein
MSFHFHRREGPGEEEPEPQPLPPHPVWEAALSAETEAFLQGRLVEHLAAAGRPVPAWAIVNKLAHASRHDLAELVDATASTDRQRDVRPPAWRVTQARLASRLVRTSAEPNETSKLQRQLLIPLELSLIERSKTEILTPRQAIAAAADALDHGHHGP